MTDSNNGVSLMQSGDYDGISASGDATTRLIAGGDVAPVNTAILPNYANVFEGLKNLPHNTVDGVNYGVPHGRGPNLLALQHRGGDARADQLGRDLGGRRRLQGQDQRLRLLDLHRRRGAAPDDHASPELGIKDPYQLNEAQFDAAIELLEQQRDNGAAVLGHVQRPGHLVLARVTSSSGTTWQFQVNLLQADEPADRGRPARTRAPPAGPTPG